MKKAVNAWTVNPACDFEDMMTQLSEAGFDGVELNLDRPGRSAHSFYLDTPDDEVRRVKALADEHGLKIVSVSSSWYGNIMGDPEQQDLLRTILRRQLQLARLLDAGAILIVPGGITADRSLTSAWQNCHSFLQGMKPEIEDSGIQVGLENTWNLFFTSPWDMCRMIDELKTPFIGAYYDVGNVAAFAHSQHWIEALGSRILRVHIKDYEKFGSLAQGGRFVQLMEGSIDWPKVMAALRKSGFDGYLTAEVSKSDPEQNDQDYYRQVAQSIDQIIRL